MVTLNSLAAICTGLPTTGLPAPSCSVAGSGGAPDDGICFTGTGMIVLGACDIGGKRFWNLLGGGVEPGETLEDCLVREVMEEGCARVAESRYIGCQRVGDPDHPTGPWRYYQSRFWARVELLPWDPQHEIDERCLVRREDLLRTLSWGSAPSAAFILAEGLKAEAERSRGSVR
jgi:NADH pyrophosphatase NudC (nudix superfamily)